MIRASGLGTSAWKAADLERSLAFSVAVLGFVAKRRMGQDAAFLAAGSSHNHLDLNTWERRDPRPRRGSGGGD